MARRMRSWACGTAAGAVAVAILNKIVAYSR
jgi:hypothetical protein